MPLLSLENVGFEYRPGRTVIRSVSATFEPGSLTAIVGPNGAGKSTLLRLLLGVLRPTSGRAMLDGTDVSRVPPPRRAGRIAYIPQSSTLAESFTVREVVALGRFARPAAGHRAIDDALSRLRLTDLAGEPFEHLSAGQQQRVTLARALAQLEGGDIPATSQALLADEPCAAMDPAHELDAMALLRDQARAGRTVLVVLHDLTTALRYADHALVLARGGTVAGHGPARDVLRPAVLDSVFDVRFSEFELTDQSTPGQSTRALVANRKAM